MNIQDYNIIEKLLKIAVKCSLRGEFNVLSRQVFFGVENLVGGCSQIGFGKKWEEDDEKQAP